MKFKIMNTATNKCIANGFDTESEARQWISWTPSNWDTSNYEIVEDKEHADED